MPTISACVRGVERNATSTDALCKLFQVSDALLLRMMNNFLIFHDKPFLMLTRTTKTCEIDLISWSKLSAIVAEFYLITQRVRREWRTTRDLMALTSLSKDVHTPLILVKKLQFHFKMPFHYPSLTIGLRLSAIARQTKTRQLTTNTLRTDEPLQ